MAITPPDASLMANAIRALAMDAVQQANSGHPGAPMGMADMAVALWGRHLKHNPADPHWPDRDRFVLSNGHASMLLYAVLHLTGYDLAVSELRRFRQLHSKTPGHPEVDVTPGVETTTGPLGQGLANAVGMALSEKLLAAEFNRPGHTLVDHRTYVFVGDGCLMEGISHEAVGMAGAWQLNKLIALYDDNGISIDGRVEPWYVDNAGLRFAAQGWNVVGPVDGNDADAVDAALVQARASVHMPTLIICKTVIGKGSPNRAGTAKAHGEALGAEEIKLTRAALNWTAEPFVVPEAAYAGWDARTKGAAAQARWGDGFADYEKAYPELAREFLRRMAGALPDNFAQIAVDAIDRLHTTAESHHRALIVEVMGRHAGWIALHSGLAGGANVILIPERPFDIDRVCAYVEARFARQFAPIIVVAEGAQPKEGTLELSAGDVDSFGHARLGGIGQVLEREIQARTGYESRQTVLGHVQRGGTPTAYDRVLATRFGLAAADAVHDGASGVMVALRGTDIVRVPLEEATRALKTVPLERYAEAEVFFG